MRHGLLHRMFDPPPREPETPSERDLRRRLEAYARAPGPVGPSTFEPRGLGAPTRPSSPSKLYRYSPIAAPLIS